MVLNILQWNIKGYHNNYQDLELLIKDRRPHVICIQETHLKHNYLPHPPKQYSAHFHNFPHITNAKQGCGILVHNSIAHKILNITSNISAVAVEVNLQYPVTIVSIYIPPLQKFSVSDLEAITSSINTPVVLAGDYNSWSPLWGAPKANPRGIVIEDFILSSNLCVLNNNSPTHFSTHNTFTHVDITLSSPQLLPLTTWYTLKDLHNSDHYPIICSISFPSNNSYKNPKPARFNTAKANWDKYQVVLISNHLPEFTQRNTNKEVAIISKAIRNAANVAIPTTFHPYRSRQVPWWSPALSDLHKEKVKAWREYQQIRTLDSLINFKKKNALFNREKKSAKRRSFENFTKEISPNSATATIWKRIKTLTGTYNPTSISSININSSNITNRSDISFEFAQHFSKSSENSNFPPQFIASARNVTTMRANDNTDNLAKHLETDINFSELEYALKSVKGTTPGFDKINYEMLKKIPKPTKLRLLQLYNSIFDSGVIPQSFKTATVIPILKPNKEPNDLRNYRPISLIPCMSKIMEKIIATRLMWYLNTKKLLSPFQVGFQSGKSTLDALLFLDHHICKNLSKKNHISILSVDFAKAFDNIGCHVVLQKLQEWQIGPKIFEYVKSFLTKRKFRCKTNHTFSKTFPLHNGIPQGSPLSVTLFLVAFDDISRLMSKHRNIKHCLYADDLYLISTQTKTSDIEESFNNALNAIHNWSLPSGALISLNKCKHLHICKKRNCSEINLKNNNYTIPNDNNMKILGVTFDSKYNFKYHCSNIRNALATRLNIIKYLSSKKSYVHTNTLIDITKLTILSKIDYGLQIYGSTSKNHLKMIKGPYHSAVRRSLRAFRTTPIKNLLTEGGFQTIESRIKYLRSRIIYKLYSYSPNVLSREIQLLNKRKTAIKRKSALCEIKELAEFLKLSFSPPKLTPAKIPPWELDSKIFINELTLHHKDKTCQSNFQKLYTSIVTPLKQEGWSFLFTDGSKQKDGVSFAVTDENGLTQSHGLLPQYANIFDAELQGLISALQMAKETNKCYVICTDSKSVFLASQKFHIRDSPLQSVQQLLMSASPKIKLMWIPSHSGILGNEQADLAAKSSLKDCLHVSCHLM